MPGVGVVNIVQGLVKLDWVTVYKKGVRCAVEAIECLEFYVVSSQATGTTG
jgi:hypothetical protein